MSLINYFNNNEVTVKELSDFTIEEWPFRNIREMQQLGQRADKLKDPTSFARRHAGIIRSPLFDFDIEMTVPCLLHLLMALGRKMLKMIVSEADGNRALEETLERILEESIGIKLKEGERTFLLRVKKSRLSRPDLIKVMKQHSLLIDALEKAASKEESRSHVQKSREIWKLMVQLLALLSTSQVTISAAFWKRKALEFARLFVAEYEHQDVTSYLHAFVYHIGYYVERYGSLEKLANYGIEGLHAKNKKFIREASNGFQRGVKLTQLELQRHFRNEYHRGTLLSAHKVEKHRAKGKVAWFEARLDVVIEHEMYVE